MSRVLLITGSSGIGAATAKLAAERGDRVFLVGKNGAECEELSSRLKDSAFSIADVTDEKAVGSAIESCISRFGRIDAVFNAAGMSGRSRGDRPLHECSTAAWQKMIDVHSTGTFFVCWGTIQHWMAKKQGGVILNLSSVLAHFPERKFFSTHA